MDKKILSIVFASLFLFSLGLVSAAANDVAFVTPTEDTVVSGSQLLNVSIATPDGAVTNVSFYYMAPGTSTWTLIGMVANTSENQTHFNRNWATTAFVDNDGYVLNATATQTDGTVVSSINVTGIDIDNGVPTATLTTSTIHNNYQVRPTDTFTLGLQADTTIGIASCQARFTNTRTAVVTTQSISASSNACSSSTLTASSIGLSRGETYNVLIRATDGNGNSTDSSSRLLKVASISGTPGGTVVDPTPRMTVFQLGGLQVAAQNVGQGIQNIFTNIINFFTNLFR